MSKTTDLRIRKDKKGRLQSTKEILERNKKYSKKMKRKKRDTLMKVDEIKAIVLKCPRVLETLDQPYRAIVERLVKTEELDKRGRAKPSPLKN